MMKELDDLTRETWGRPASHCTIAELLAAVPGPAVTSVLDEVGFSVATMASVTFTTDGHRRNGVEVPLKELLGGGPVVGDASSLGARDAFDMAHRAVKECGCSVAVERDEQGRILLATSRPEHTCKETA